MEKLSNLMLLANFLSSLFYSMSYPYIYAETLKAVSTYYISFEQIITCISTVIFSVAWNRAGDKIFRHYRKIMIAEIIADIILFVDVIIRGDLKFYFAECDNICCNYKEFVVWRYQNESESKPDRKTA